MTVERGSIVSRQDILRMTTEIVAAYAGQNNVDSENLSRLIIQVHETLDGLSNGAPQLNAAQKIRKPAIPVRRSVNPDFLV